MTRRTTGRSPVSQVTVTSVGIASAALVSLSLGGCAQLPATATEAYPWHTNIVATTFWVGELFDPSVSDGSQVFSTYNSTWYESYGGCDGVLVDDGYVGLTCETEPRLASTDYFPSSMKPRENPFYIDLPFDDVNNEEARGMRADVVPWAAEAEYAGVVADPKQSLMKNRWVLLHRDGRVCYAQIQDAGPGEYNDAEYVFGDDDARPANTRFGGAGLDVSPAVNGCLGFEQLDGNTDRVDWVFVDFADVPPGPWLRIITTSGVQ